VDEDEALERGVDGHADRLGIHVGADGAVRLARPDERGHVLALLAVDALGDPQELGAGARRVDVEGDEESVERLARGVQARARVDEPEQPLAPRALRGVREHLLGVPVDGLPVDRLHEAVLGAEVVVQRALGDARVGRDGVEARPQAVGGEAPDRGIEQAPAGRLRRGRAGGARRRHARRRVWNGRDGVR
jgi:hypothetical protein